MNFLTVFEQRIAGVFGDTPTQAAPFSFKKLAKKAAHEMENETYIINGVDTAPALYTILVSHEDDQRMRPYYGSLTQETSQFIEAQASKRGYAFVGAPLVRFLVDPGIKPGKFTVFAENVDVRTLNHLRDEEVRFLGGQPLEAPVAPRQQQQAGVHAAAGARRELGDGLAELDAVSLGGAGTRAAGAAPAALSDLPGFEPAVEPIFDAPGAPGAAGDFQAADAANPFPPAPAAQGAPAAGVAAAHGGAVPLANARAGAATPAPIATPIPVQDPNNPPTEYRPFVPGMTDAYAAPAPAAVAQAPAQKLRPALLIDRTTGRTYTCDQQKCIIGRERGSATIVLRDPNISRRHAELTFTGVRWVIQDLNSTNGTLVNDVDIDECVLTSGDLITLGLTNLEFREG